MPQEGGPGKAAAPVAKNRGKARIGATETGGSGVEPSGCDTDLGVPGA